MTTVAKLIDDIVSVQPSEYDTCNCLEYEDEPPPMNWTCRAACQNTMYKVPTARARLVDGCFGDRFGFRHI